MTNIIKIINRTIVRWAFIITLGIAGVLPRNFLFYFVDRIIMLVLFRTNSRLVHTARNNIDIVYQDRKTPDEKQALVRGSFKNLGRVIAEIIYYRTHTKSIDEVVEIEGEHLLKTALNKRKGVIAVTGHLGNFPFMVYWFALRGYKINVLMRPPRDEKMGKIVSDSFADVGGRILFTVPERLCVQKSIQALRANEILVILIDQNYGAEARVFVDFFGKQAATGASPIAFARRTGASILPMFSVHKNGKMHVVVQPEVALQGHKGDHNSIQINMQMLTNIVEDFVIQYPDLWSWMHNRWKTKVTASDKHAVKNNHQSMQTVNV